MSKNPIIDASVLLNWCKKYPLKQVFSLGPARPANNGTHFWSVIVTDPETGKRQDCTIRFSNERHVGQIAPLNEADVAELNAKQAQSKYKYNFKKRDRKPTLNFQKFPSHVETNEKGEPVGDLPEETSELFELMTCIDNFVYEEMQAMIDAKKIVLRNTRNTAIPVGALAVPDIKIVQAVQTHVSMLSATNPGAKLANPIARVNIEFDQNGALKSKLYKFVPETHPSQFPPLEFDGKPADENNIHLIKSGSWISMIVSFAVCSSQMGLSLVRKITAGVVKDPPPRVSDTVCDVFGDEYLSQFAPAAAATTVAATTVAAAPAAAAAAAPASPATAVADELDEVDLDAVYADMNA